jgi:Fur family transcriptional regulator, peroxide stress response regulator
MANKQVIKILVENGLKVTPQRIAVLEVMLTLKNHPDADNVIEYIRINFPHVSIGTVYKTLETFVEKGILKRVKTESGAMRYDNITERHHHLYCVETERIEDFYDNELSDLIDKYLQKKKIPDFVIKDIKLQIVGEFTEKSKTRNNNQK